jgi:hypothetical protein
LHPVPQGPSGSPPLAASLIRVAAKSKSCYQPGDAFVEYCGFLNQMDKYDTLLQNIDDRTILRKLLHPPSPLDIFDPAFHFPYKEAIHSDCLRLQLNFSHLPPSTHEKSLNL